MKPLTRIDDNFSSSPQIDVDDLEFFYLPVVPGQINDSHVSQFKTAMETLPGPVLGYCKLGMRAKTLYQRARPAS